MAAKLPTMMIHPALRNAHGQVEECGVTRNIVAAIFCDMETLWAIASAFGDRDGFGRELVNLAVTLEERIAADEGERDCGD